MANKIDYPLERVLDIKRKRVENQEKVVRAKEQELEKEQAHLKKCEAERDKIVQHRQDKLNQLREEMDHGTTTDKIIQIKNYIKVVEEKVKIEEKKVAEQKEQVRKAKKNLEEAKELLRLKRQEVDKLVTHRTDWIKDRKRELQFEEQKEMDEVGQTLYTIHQRRGY